MATDVRKPMAYYADRRERRVAKIRAMSAAEAIGGITHETGWTLLTNGTFSMIDVVAHVLSQTGPADLLITTWVPGNQELADLYALVQNGDIRHLKLIVDYGFATARPRGAELLLDLFGQGSVFETRNHAKVACIQNDEWNYCVRGSLNLNGNTRCENIDGDDSPDMCQMMQDVYRDISTSVGSGIGHDGGEVGKAFRDAMFEAKRKRGRRGNTPSGLSAKRAASLAGIRL